MKTLTYEIVFRGHHDKLADQISDAVLMAYLQKDKESIVNVEVVGGEDIVFVKGTAYSNVNIDIENIVQAVLVDVDCCVDSQIVDDVQKLPLEDYIEVVEDVDSIFGYANDETESLLPKGMLILQDIAKEYEKLRKSDDRFKADGKVIMEGTFDENYRLLKVDSLLINHQNNNTDPEDIKYKMEQLVYSVIEKYEVPVDKIEINPYGSYLLGGFDRDTGMTGMKRKEDSYQRFTHRVRSKLSGADPKSARRSGFYKARDIAKELLIENDLKWCEVQIDYNAGSRYSKPYSITANSNIGEIDVDEGFYDEAVPSQVVRDLDLLNKDYVNLSSYGHIQD